MYTYRLLITCYTITVRGRGD